MLVDRVEERLLLHTDTLAGAQSQLLQDIDRHFWRMVPVVDFAELCAPGELRRIDPFEVADHEHRLAETRHDYTMVAVVARRLVTAKIGDVLRASDQDDVQSLPGHGGLD